MYGNTDKNKKIYMQVQKCKPKCSYYLCNQVHDILNNSNKTWIKSNMYVVLNTNSLIFNLVLYANFSIYFCYLYVDIKIIYFNKLRVFLKSNLWQYILGTWGCDLRMFINNIAWTLHSTSGVVLSLGLPINTP